MGSCMTIEHEQLELQINDEQSQIDNAHVQSSINNGESLISNI